MPYFEILACENTEEKINLLSIQQSITLIEQSELCFYIDTNTTKRSETKVDIDVDESLVKA